MTSSSPQTSSGEPPLAPTTGRTWGRLALVVLLLGGVGLFYALGLERYFTFDSLRESLDGLHRTTREHPVLAVLVFFLVYAAAAALSLPIAAYLSLLGGALFGRWLGTGVVLLAATLGASLAFLSSRFLFASWVQRRFGARIEALQEGVARDGPYYLFVLRVVPVFPFFLINLGMGLTRIPLSTYAWVTLAGMLPGAFLYVNTGAALQGLERPGDIFSPVVVVSFALLGLAPLLLRDLVQRSLRRSTVAAVLLTAAVVLLLAVFRGR